MADVCGAGACMLHLAHAESMLLQLQPNELELGTVQLSRQQSYKAALWLVPVKYVKLAI